MYANLFPLSEHYITEVLELIHSDFKALYPMKKKSDTFSCFQKFKAWAENLTGKKIKRLCDDKGGEYMSNECQKFLDECGIIKGAYCL